MLLFVPQSQAALPQEFPKLANYYLDWDLTPERIERLAEWDLVIISNAAYSRYPSAVRELKAHNPNITVLVYVVANEAALFGPTLENGNLFKDIYSYVDANDLWLYTPQGDRIMTWPQTNWINASLNGKQVNGQYFVDWLAQQATQRYIVNAEFDGIFYDNIFDNIWWASTTIDIDNNGTADSRETVNAAWQQGMVRLIQQTQARAPGKIVIGNTNTNFYNQYMNGRLHEHFPRPQEGGWVGSTAGYLNPTIGKSPQAFVINSNNQNIDNATSNLRHVRFTYTTALLGEGFYSFTVGDQSHGSLWWYDEYNMFLGSALGEPENLLSSSDVVQPGVWRREFENGVIYLNSTDTARTINLQGDFEKLRGIQDPAHNNGAIVREITLQPNDGIVLQKRVTEVVDAPFMNGSFVKPFDKRGVETQRNGFFVFNRAGQGSDVVAHVDLDGDGSRETIVGGDTLVTVYNASGSTRFSFTPYGTGYRFGLTLDIGDVDGDGQLEIVTGTRRGFEPLVKIFDHEGNEQPGSFHAYAKTYKGGVNVALADLNGNGTKDIVVGAGYLGGPQVRIFNGKGQLVSGGFYAYSPTFRGGVNVAAGDIDGDGVDEIITGAGVGGSTHVRIFNGKTKPLSPGFFAFSETSRAGVQVFVADLNNDGIDEVLAATPNPFE